MDCHHDAAPAALWSHGDVRTVVERAGRLAFWATLLCIRGQLQAHLDLWRIQHRVVLAASDKGKACHISEHGSGAIGSIQAQQHALFEEVMGLQILLDDRERPAQFLS